MINARMFEYASKEPNRSNEPIRSNDSHFTTLVSAHLTPTIRSTDRCEHEALWLDRTNNLHCE